MDDFTVVVGRMLLEIRKKRTLLQPHKSSIYTEESPEITIIIEIIEGSDVMVTGQHRLSLSGTTFGTSCNLLLVRSSRVFRLLLFRASCSYFQLLFYNLIMESYKKSYAKAVTGPTSFLIHACWSHLQTQDEDDAIVLAVQNSLGDIEVA